MSNSHYTQQQYYILLGRRQPAHMGHVNQLRDVIHHNGFPIIFIGSINEPSNKFYNPLQNPLNLEESIMQLNIILEKEKISEYKIIPIKDFGDDDPWINCIINSVKENFPNAKMKDIYFHFFTKNSKADETFKTLDKYIGMFQQKGINSVIFAGNKDSNNLSSSHFRKLSISDAEFSKLPACNYLKDLILKARVENKKIFGDLIDDNLPLTMLDLSLRRIVLECGINKKKLGNKIENLKNFEEVIKNLIKK